MAEFDAMNEPLIFKTTFISIDELDLAASRNGINLHDGHRHHFRSCYINEINYEVASSPFNIINNETTGLLVEIMLVKIARIWNAFFEDIKPFRLKEYLVVSLSEYLHVNPFQFEKTPFYMLRFKEADFRFKENEGNVSQASLPYQLFVGVYDFIDKLSEKIDINLEVPSIYTNPLNNYNRQQNEMIEGFGEIDVASIVF